MDVDKIEKKERMEMEVNATALKKAPAAVNYKTSFTRNTCEL